MEDGDEVIVIDSDTAPTDAVVARRDGLEVFKAAHDASSSRTSLLGGNTHHVRAVEMLLKVTQDDLETAF